MATLINCHILLDGLAVLLVYLKNCVEKLQKARQNNDYSNIKCLEKDLSFYGSGAILHQLFFENMGIPIPTNPSICLMEQINKDFGSYEKFKNQFTEASKAVEASRLGSVSVGSKI